MSFEITVTPDKSSPFSWTANRKVDTREEVDEYVRNITVRMDMGVSAKAGMNIRTTVEQIMEMNNTKVYKISVKNAQTGAVLVHLGKMTIKEDL